MTRTPLSAGGDHEIDLHADQVLGKPPPEEILRGRFTLSWDVRRVTSAVAPPEWCAYASDFGRTHAFCYLELICTFKPETPQARGAFERADLGLNLTSPDTAAPAPVARYISAADPAQASDITRSSSITATVNLGPLLKTEVRTEASSASRHQAGTVTMYGAGGSAPAWIFQATRDTPLKDDRRVAALIQASHGGHNVAHVAIRARISHRQGQVLKIFGYHADLSLGPWAIPLRP
jgi:hypothetical protein